MSEILGTLFKYLLALLAITAVVAILYEALSSNKVSTAAAQITTLQANINQLYAGTSAGPTGLSNQTLVQANEIPSGMPVNSTGYTINNSWGGSVTILPSGASLPGDADITYDSVPQEACNKLALALLPSMTQITINSTAVKPGDTNAVTEVATACAPSTTGTSGGSNMTFTFPVS